MLKNTYKHNRLRQSIDMSRMTPGAIELLSRMLTMDPKRRITAIEAFGVRALLTLLCTLR